MELITNKRYKNNSGRGNFAYFKFSCKESGCGTLYKYNKFHYSEIITCDMKHILTNYYFSMDEISINCIEVPLSEIQQYLPEWHPDKEFILPEKWCVKDCEEVSKWASKIFGCGHFVSSNAYLCVDKKEFPKFNSYFFYYKNSALNYTEITLEQFKKYVSKQDNMNKEIIGYKLKEDCKQYEEAALKIMNANWGTPKYHVTVSWCIEDLRKAGILELWFEPILKEKFKVGDAIIALNPNDTNACGLDINKLYYITKIADDGQYENEKYCSCSNVKNGPRVSQGDIKLSGIRLATPEEIKKTLAEEAIKRGFTKGVKIKAYFPDYSPVYSGDRPYEMNDGLPEYEQHSDALRMGGSIIYHKGKWAEILPSNPQIEINGYKGEFFDSSVRFGCAEISKWIFIELNKSEALNHRHSYGNKEIEPITIGKGVFTKDQIKQIAEYYLNKK